MPSRTNQQSVSSLLRVGLPGTTYVEDFETRRVLESIKTALRKLGLVLDGLDDESTFSVTPDTELLAGQNIRISTLARNRFRISAVIPPHEDDSDVIFGNTGSGSSSGLDLSTCRLGYSISGTTCTLKAGAINFSGKQQVSVAEATFAMAGTQYAYVHHVRGSGAAAWAVAGAEPGVGSTTDLDVTCYKFVNGAHSLTYRIGDILFDLPLA